MAGRHVTTDAEFFCEHLPYELAMLRASRGLLSPWPPQLWAVQNALLEACALHARNLVEFFRNDEGGCAFRVRAFVSPAYVVRPGFLPRHYRDKLHTVVHLTGQRTATGPARLNSDDLASIEHHIGEALADFLAHLLPHYRATAEQCGNWRPLREWTEQVERDRTARAHPTEPAQAATERNA